MSAAGPPQGAVAPSPPTPLPHAGEGSDQKLFIPSPTCERGCPAGAGEGQAPPMARYSAIALPLEGSVTAQPYSVGVP